MAPNFDVLVIGSGFGGAVTACRLAEKGMRVLVLERGRRWEIKDYPSQSGKNWLYHNERPQCEQGWVDWRFWGKMSVVCGAAVGGGSLIYANVSAQAHREAFDKGWPPEIKYEDLQQYYDVVGKMLNVQTIPDGQLTHRFKLVQEAAQKAGYGDRFTKMPVAITFDPKFTYDQPDPFNNKNSVKHRNDQGVEQGTCIHCGNCDFGCQVHAKNTLDLNYIPQAEKYHAEVRPLHYVRYIEPIDGGYRVTFDRIIPGSFPEEGKLVRGSETARKVIVSAGSLGSTELLLRCRDQYKTLPKLSRFLGHNWSSNGDFLTLGVYPASRTVAPSYGPTITCYINFLDQPFQDQRFVIEDGGFPPLLRDYLERKLSQSEHGIKQPHVKAVLDSLGEDLRNEDPLKNIMPWFANGVDRADGQLYLGRECWTPWRKRLKLKWPDDSAPLIEAIIAMQKELTQVTGGKHIVSPMWTEFKWLITPHPLGGCNMGTAIENGVVNHQGAVFGYPGLYVADGSIVPEAVGLNPSRTIAALSERIAHFIGMDDTGPTRLTVPGN